MMIINENENENNEDSARPLQKNSGHVGKEVHIESDLPAPDIKVKIA